MNATLTEWCLKQVVSATSDTQLSTSTCSRTETLPVYVWETKSGRSTRSYWGSWQLCIRAGHSWPVLGRDPYDISWERCYVVLVKASSTKLGAGSVAEDHLSSTVTGLRRADLFSLWPVYRDACFLPAPRYASGGKKQEHHVRPSITRRYCIKTKKANVMISSPSGSPTILVFWCLISSQNSKGSPRAGTSNKG